MLASAGCDDWCCSGRWRGPASGLAIEGPPAASPGDALPCPARGKPPPGPAMTAGGSEDTTPAVHRDWTWAREQRLEGRERPLVTRALPPQAGVCQRTKAPPGWLCSLAQRSQGQSCLWGRSRFPLPPEYRATEVTEWPGSCKIRQQHCVGFHNVLDRGLKCRILPLERTSSTHQV